MNREAKRFDDPPDIKNEGPGEEENRTMQSFRESCRGDARACAALLDTYAEDAAFTAFEQRRLQRYRELLKRHVYLY